MCACVCFHKTSLTYSTRSHRWYAMHCDDHVRSVNAILLVVWKEHVFWGGEYNINVRTLFLRGFDLRPSTSDDDQQSNTKSAF